jgi:hypothetical protein
MARYQRGFLRKKKGKWVYCWTAIRPSDGARTERGRVVGLVAELYRSRAVGPRLNAEVSTCSSTSRA